MSRFKPKRYSRKFKPKRRSFKSKRRGSAGKIRIGYRW